MDVNRYGFVIASFGDRDAYIESMVSNIRQYSNFPILLITDRARNTHVEYTKVIPKGELRWRDSPRWGVRNTNYWLAKAAIDEYFDVSCCLNDDMRIVSPGFVDGFRLAVRFGLCLPLNPRIHVKYNAMGTDSSDADIALAGQLPSFAPACNMSPMFACRHHAKPQILLQAYLNRLETCMRGTLAFWFACCDTNLVPLYLPEQWCVCGSSAAFIKNLTKVLRGKAYSIEPIMLHWGQKQVRDVFRGVTQ